MKKIILTIIYILTLSGCGMVTFQLNYLIKKKNTGYLF